MKCSCPKKTAALIPSNIFFYLRQHTRAKPAFTFKTGAIAAHIHAHTPTHTPFTLKYVFRNALSRSTKGGSFRVESSAGVKKNDFVSPRERVTQKFARGMRVKFRGQRVLLLHVYVCVCELAEKRAGNGVV